MKKILSMSFVVLMVAATYCVAQTDSGKKGEQKGEMMQQGMKMDEGMMTVQEKMMMGPDVAEKMKMMKDMGQMKEKMQKMMSMPMPMEKTRMDDSQSKLTCAEPWLKKAMDLHDWHMKNPATTTDASQIELMDHIKKAYGCITGAGPEMSGTKSNEVADKEELKKAEPSETDPHIQ